MSVLTEVEEKLVHLIARAFARTHGQVQSAETYAGTVLEHARTIAAEDAGNAKEGVEVKPEEPKSEAPAPLEPAPAPVAAAPVAEQPALPAGDQPQQVEQPAP